MAREYVVNVWCERHPDKEAEEVTLTVGGETRAVDLCADCRAPLVELMKLGKIAPAIGAKRPVRGEQSLISRVRGLPPPPA